ncbi:MAG TPA: fluoride efflux transporter CrcB [Parasegetibacter sp.]
MIKSILLVGLGSAIGGICRYLAQNALIKFTPGFPLGTFLVNFLGCFLIGIFYGLSQRTGSLNEEWTIFLTTGLCGGFTTFSAFSMENVLLLQNHHYGTFFLYFMLSLIVGILATFAGMMMMR